MSTTKKQAGQSTPQIRSLETALGIREGLAIHEAAHVVVARYFDFPVAAVTLDDGLKGGSVSTPLRPKDIVATRGLMVMTAAGNVAASMCGYHNHSEPDEKELVAAATRLHGTLAVEDAVFAEVADANYRAERILREYWDNLLRTAVFLLQFHELVANQLRKPSSDPMTLLVGK